MSSRAFSPLAPFNAVWKATLETVEASAKVHGELTGRAMALGMFPNPLPFAG